LRGSIQTHRPTILPFVGPRFRHLKAPSSTLSELLVGGQETIETSRERKEGPRGHRHVRAGHWMRDVGQHPGYMGIVAREGRERWLTNLRTCHVFVVALDQDYSTGHALRAEHHGCEGSTASEQQQKSQMGGGPGSARKRMNTKARSRKALQKPAGIARVAASDSARDRPQDRMLPAANKVAFPSQVTCVYALAATECIGAMQMNTRAAGWSHL
jgi:hypothetical protein